MLMTINTFDLATELELRARVLEGIVWLQGQQGNESDPETILLIQDLLRFTSEKLHDEFELLTAKAYNKESV